MFRHLSRVLTVLVAGAVCASGAAVAADTVAVDSNLLAYQPAAAVAPPKGASYVLRDGSIRISGAEHAQYILERLDALFTKTHPGVAFAPELKGTGTGIPMLTHGVTPFAVLGRAVTPIELVPYEKIVGEKPLEIKVAHTAYASKQLATSLAVYVNAANPIDKLSLEEVTRIFTTGDPSGDLTSWGQLGESGEWKSAPIIPVSAFAYGGFGNYEAVKFHHRPFAPNVEQYPDTAAILKRVAQDPFTIGIAATGRTDSGVKSIALAAKSGGTYSNASNSDVVDGTYPFGRYLYFYVRQEKGKPIDPFVKEYLRLVLSRDGQQIIASQPGGYLPLTAHEAAAELAKLEETK